MLTHTLGFPRIGVMRELKKAVEAFWKKTAANDGVSSAEDIVLFEKQALIIRRANWIMQGQNGIDLVPAGDFSLYDHILDMTCALGAIPERFGYKGGDIDLATYFRMARGGHDNDTTTPMEMTKWYDTNYHYIVP